MDISTVLGGGTLQRIKQIAKTAAEVTAGFVARTLTITGLFMLMLVMAACADSAADKAAIEAAAETQRRLELESAAPLTWPEMAHCLHNAGTSMPGDEDIDKSGRWQLTYSARTLCGIQLAGHRPEQLPDANCYADELLSYKAQYHVNDESTWGRARAYATMACAPVATDMPREPGDNAK